MSTAELNGQLLTFHYVGKGDLHRLEIAWHGDTDPPWYGNNGLEQGVVARVLSAAQGVEGVSRPRENLSSSMHLRVWVGLPRGSNQQHKRDQARRALVKAVRGVLTPVAA